MQKTHKWDKIEDLGPSTFLLDVVKYAGFFWRLRSPNTLIRNLPSKDFIQFRDVSCVVHWDTGCWISIIFHCFFLQFIFIFTTSLSDHFQYKYHHSINYNRLPGWKKEQSLSCTFFWNFWYSLRRKFKAYISIIVSK